MVPEDFFGALPVDVHRLLHVYVLARCLEIDLDFFFFFSCVTEETLNTSTYSGWNKT